MLLLPVALVLLEPEGAPPSSAPPPSPPALPTTPPDPQLTRTESLQAKAAPPAEDKAAVVALPAAVDANVVALPAAIDASEEQTLYLTIVGDKIYRVMGPVSGRPPRVDELPALARAGLGERVATPGSASATPGAGVVIADLEQIAPSLAPDERPLGPAPQECPRTLPPGSDQSTADSLRRQSGCRYLSSCTADTNECTFYYQGRG